MDTQGVRRYRVIGRVQGVGFRWFVREAARAESLCGWVRNEPNGDVLLEVGGFRDALDRLHELLWAGPAASDVAQVLLEPSQAVGVWELPTPFAVHR